MEPRPPVGPVVDAEGDEQFAFGPLPTTSVGEQSAEVHATDPRNWQLTGALDVVVDRDEPVLRPLDVGGHLAGVEEGAVDLPGSPRVRDKPAGDRRYGLVDHGHPLGDVPQDRRA